MQRFSKMLWLSFLCSCAIGCRSTDEEHYADLGLPVVQANTSAAPASAVRGSAKIVIKGTKAGVTQPDIAQAVLAATRKLATTSTATDASGETRMANEAADAILAGDKVVLEGASPEAADAIAQELRKAGLLVTTTR